MFLIFLFLQDDLLLQIYICVLKSTKSFLPFSSKISLQISVFVLGFWSLDVWQHTSLSITTNVGLLNVICFDPLQEDIHLHSIITFSQSLAARRYFCVHYINLYEKVICCSSINLFSSFFSRSVNEVICHGIPDAR